MFSLKPNCLSSEYRSKQAFLFDQLINKDIISMNKIKGRLPEKPIRPTLLAALQKKSKLKKNI